MSDKKITKDKFLDFIKSDKDRKLNRTGRNEKYYDKVFEKYGFDKRPFIKWNTAAFFFGSFWMFYRGMYSAAILFLLGELVIYNFAFDGLAQHAFSDFLIVSVSIMLFYAFFGNAIYFRFVRKKMERDEKAEGTHPHLVIAFALLAFPAIDIFVENTFKHIDKREFFSESPGPFFGYRNMQGLMEDSGMMHSKVQEPDNLINITWHQDPR